MSASFDTPSAAELLEALREFLQRDVVPGTEGRLSFHARVAANVVGILERELALGPELLAAQQARLAELGVGSDAELAAGIRAGACDDRWGEVLAAVRASVDDRLRVSNPGYLD